MASHNTLRQVSRILQSNKSHLNPSRTRQYSSHTLFSSRPRHQAQSICRHSYRCNAAQQSRNLSLWGSSSKTASAPTPDSSANVIIEDPASHFDSKVRAVKASSDTSADTSFLPGHAAHTPEPQLVSQAQDSLLGVSDPSALPPTEALVETPERIGYLKEVCGLDFGWGPTAIMESLFEHIHIWGGLSWTTSIVLLGVALRGTMVPFLLEQSRQTARMREMHIVAKPIQDDMKAAYRDQDQMRIAQCQSQLQSLKKDYKVKYSKAFLPMLIQLPFGFGAWRLLRNAAELPVPGFVQESWLWNVDLTFSDGLYIMPALSAALLYATIRMNKKATKATGQVTTVGATDFTSLLMYFMPPITFLFIMWQPGAVQIYFVTSSAVGFVTAWFMQRPFIRRYFDLPELKSATAATGAVGAADAGTTFAQNQTARFMRTRPTSPVIDAQARVSDDVASSETSSSNRSGIDRAVDKVKSQFDGIRGSMRGMTENMVGTEEERKMKSAKEREEYYEAKYRAELDKRRKEQNRAMGIIEEDDTASKGRRR